MVDKKVAIITGAGRGLGEAVAKDLLGKGISVVVADMNKIDIYKYKVNSQFNDSANIMFHQVDVSKRVEVKRMFASAFKRFKQIEVPLLLLILAGFSYETGSSIGAIILIILSVVRLYLNYVLFEEIPEDFSRKDKREN